MTDTKEASADFWNEFQSEKECNFLIFFFLLNIYSKT